MVDEIMVNVDQHETYREENSMCTFKLAEKAAHQRGGENRSAYSAGEIYPKVDVRFVHRAGTSESLRFV